MVAKSGTCVVPRDEVITSWCLTNDDEKSGRYETVKDVCSPGLRENFPQL